jgi:hypothetical protein
MTEHWQIAGSSRVPLAEAVGDARGCTTAAQHQQTRIIALMALSRLPFARKHSGPVRRAAFRAPARRPRLGHRGPCPSPGARTRESAVGWPVSGGRCA